MTDKLDQMHSEDTGDITCSGAATVAPLPTGRVYNDFELVAGLKVADPTISAAFFDQYQSLINGMVWKLLGQDSEHDDVVNIVFADILSSAKSIRDPQTLPKWVSMVSLNAVRRELRSRKYRRFFTPITDSPPEPTIEGPDTKPDLYRRVYSVMKTMSPQNHILFALRFVEGHTYDEIAELRDCSVATAKRHVKRSRQEFMKKAQKDLVLRSFVEGCEND